MTRGGAELIVMTVGQRSRSQCVRKIWFHLWTKKYNSNIQLKRIFIYVQVCKPIFFKHGRYIKINSKRALYVRRARSQGDKIQKHKYLGISLICETISSKLSIDIDYDHKRNNKHW